MRTKQMYLSILNNAHKDVKYLIIDQSEELNLPNIPSGFSFVFQEKYSSNIKIVNDEELKKIFKNNTLMYEVTFFNSDFKLDDEDAKKIIKSTLNDYFNKVYKINSSFVLQNMNKDIIDFINLPHDTYNKSAIDNLTSLVQQKINKIKEDINIINNEKVKGNLSEIYEVIENLRSELNIIKNECM